MFNLSIVNDTPSFTEVKRKIKKSERFLEKPLPAVTRQGTGNDLLLLNWPRAVLCVGLWLGCGCAGAWAVKWQLSGACQNGQGVEQEAKEQGATRRRAETGQSWWAAGSVHSWVIGVIGVLSWWLWLLGVCECPLIDSIQGQHRAAVGLNEQVQVMVGEMRSGARQEKKRKVRSVRCYRTPAGLAGRNLSYLSRRRTKFET